ncbi:MAG TPA: hypothetical protein EYG86_06595 [Crocinitomicaceae bacterium]|nr:hypothetical protein [Crocinitomicaceae bacterium]
MAEVKITKKQQKLNKIIADLNSSEEKKVSKAIKSLEANGDSSVIKPLATRLMQDLSDKNKSEIIELLSSLKDTSARAELMYIVDDEKFLPIRQSVLTAIWNTKIDFSGYVDEFVFIAIHGSFLEAIDCLTIIENLEGPFMEEDLLESESHLKNYMTSDAPKDEQRAVILSEIALKLKDFMLDVDSDDDFDLIVE